MGQVVETAGRTRLTTVYITAINSATANLH